jgi:hypothetical protein
MSIRCKEVELVWMSCSPWLGTIRELQRLFNDADQVTAARPSSQAQPALGANAPPAAAMLFDDDLDLQTKAMPANGR